MNRDGLPTTVEELEAYCKLWADDILVHVWNPPKHLGAYPTYQNLPLSKLSEATRAYWMRAFKRGFLEDGSIPHRRLNPPYEQPV